MTLTNLEVYHGTTMLQYKGMTRTNLEVFHDGAVQPLESKSSFLFCFCLFGFCFLLPCVLWAF